MKVGRKTRRFLRRAKKLGKEFLNEGKEIARFVGEEARVVHAGVSPMAEQSYSAFSQPKTPISQLQQRESNVFKPIRIRRKRFNFNNLSMEM